MQKFFLGNTKLNTNILLHSVINGHAIFTHLIWDISHSDVKLLMIAIVVFSITTR